MDFILVKKISQKKEEEKRGGGVRTPSAGRWHMGRSRSLRGWGEQF